MEEIKVTRLTSLKGEDFLVLSTKDGNTLPEVKIFKQIENAYNVAEDDFGISSEREDKEKKSKKNTREMWNDIFKKGTFLLLIFSILSLVNCSKKFNSEEDVLKLIQNSEWKDDVVQNVDGSTVASKYYYFDSSGNCYTNYYQPGNYKSNDVERYNYHIKLSTAENGVQNIQIVLSGGFNPPLLYLKPSNPDQIGLFETSASFSGGNVSAVSETRDLNRVQ